MYMKKFIAFLIVVCFVFSFSSCVANTSNSQNNTTNNSQNNTTNNSQNSPTIPEKNPTAYEQLNQNEKIIFDALIINFDWFYVPSSVKITKIYEGLGFEWDNCGETIPTKATYDLSIRTGISITLKLNLENESGNNAQTYISLNLTDGTLANEISGYKKGHLEVIEKDSQRFPIFASEPEFLYANPGKINKALAEYCNEMGYN